MPEPERRLYEEIEKTRRRHAQVDQEPLLRSEGDQPTLDPPATVPKPELSELRGIPAPRLPELNALEVLSLPELHPLPARDRTFVFKPRRQLTAAPSKRCQRWRRPSSRDAAPPRSPSGARPR